jgi:hypothetical protein
MARRRLRLGFKSFACQLRNANPLGLAYSRFAPTPLVKI